MVKYNNIIKAIEYYIKCVQWKKHIYVTSDGIEIVTKYREYKQKKLFRDALLKAYDGQLTDGWRVDAYEDNETPLPVDNWDGCKMFVTDKGSTVAIREDGDIISVCKNLSNGIPDDNMKAIMEIAVEEGGTKLDSFDGNYGFYRACGFVPVSWIHFNEEYAPAGPNGWIKGEDKSEPIMFMRYDEGAKKSLSPREAYEEKSNFYRNVVANTGEDAYDDAYALRDNEMR